VIQVCTQEGRGKCRTTTRHDHDHDRVRLVQNPIRSTIPVVMWQDSNNHYGASSSQAHSPYYPMHAQQNVPLQFYAAGSDQGQFYPGSRSSLEGNMGASASVPSGSVAQAYGGTIQQPGGWWTAFGTGGFEGEPPLLEGEATPSTLRFSCQTMLAELGINFSHIRAKSMTVLNPLEQVDEHIMDDADLAGPLLFFLLFGMLLLLVSGLSNHTASRLTKLDSPENHSLATSMVSACWGRCRYTPSSTSCLTKASTFTALCLFWAIAYSQWSVLVQ